MGYLIISLSILASLAAVILSLSSIIETFNRNNNQYKKVMEDIERGQKKSKRYQNRPERSQLEKSLGKQHVKT